ncbi:signal peptidase II Aspartic peptidase. MEROPS family A08 [Deinococcus reticulitermitis]|uniref:Lipoprotein signal peptidase n=1 Tax=Deinococcus reticulitermitis TaxID=856736 RepID=A0A1H6YRN8_9DEIO|nr:signal peptidase II [Deinococcus reticulitermitis]SEJ43931.1 signal peptidase II Aspartic peptidase. MEROPS family A08 [Deinococcus reticulitermitis]
MQTPPHSRPAPLWFPLLLAAALIAADQALKAWALAHLTYGADAIPVIPGLLDWQLTFNTGAAWSLFSGSARPLAALRLIVGLGILAYLWKRPQTWFLTTVLALIAAGAIGNTIDGLTNPRGVVDMIHSPALSAVTRALNGSIFPIFNIADMCVVGGTLLLLGSSLLPERKAQPPTQEDGSGA